MPISPEYLPNELHYIIPLAEQHGSSARILRYDHHLGRHVEYAEKLTEGDIEPLRRLYVEMRARNHGQLINRWHRSHSGKRTCPPETSWPVYGLLCLFRQLARLDIAPFNDGAVAPEESNAAETLDWNKLPPPLRYLSGPAEVYGALQFDPAIYEFLHERMTADEQAELQALNQQSGTDWEQISRWLEEYPMTEHPEARLVYFTVHLLAIGSDLGLL